ncbi:MAG: hypothetical protein M3R49_12705 [Chloroflexota bacterium]|nr:hypothetical protein [Chloroflexota bacterium]
MPSDTSGHLPEGLIVAGKAELVRILERWLEASDAQTIGDIEKRLKITPWLFADVGDHRIRVNADTRREAVARFVRINTPDLRLWPVVVNNRGTVNKVLQSPDRERVKYWNAYLVRPVPAEIFI